MKYFYASFLFLIVFAESKSQNVGIGTANPLEKLHIEGSVRGNQAGALRINTGNGYVDIGPKNTSWSHFETDRARYYFNRGVTVDEGLIGSYDEDLSLQTSGTTRISVLNSNGNVGIGITNPLYKLHWLGGSATTISGYTDGYVRDMSGRLARNLVSSHQWSLGTGGVAFFNPNEDNASENVREWGDGPHGQRAILWKCSPSGNGNPDGGWNTNSFTIDNTKTYRVSVWVKRTGSQSTGTTYLGCGGSGINYLNGSSETNPYFFCGTLPQVDRWYLIVGYIHGSGDAATTHSGGVYDGVTGQKVISLNGGGNCSTDFKFSTSATTQYHRAYLYYNNDAVNRQYFWDPRFEEVNGHEPTVAALLGNASASIGFSGTTNYVAKFTSPSTIGNSQIFDNGTNVGVGNTSPAVKLDISGTARIANNLEIFNNASLIIMPEVGSNTSYSGFFANGNGFMSDGIPWYWGIGREPGSWTHPYPDLMIHNHTGVSLSGHGNYDGISFWEPLNSAGSSWLAKGRLIARIRDDAWGGNIFNSRLHISRDDAGECCAGGNYTLSLAEATTTTGNRSRIQFHNGGESEGTIMLTQEANTGVGLADGRTNRRIQFFDNQGSGLGLQLSGNLWFGNGNSRTQTRTDAGLQGDQGAQSGFFETSAPAPAANWPTGASSWWHLIDTRHSNNGNNYALQIAGSFFNQDLYFRKTNNNPAQPWTKISTVQAFSATGTTDISMNSTSWTSTGLTLTFVPQSGTALVQFTMSGRSNPSAFPVQNVFCRILLNGTVIGGSQTPGEDTDGSATVTTWSMSFSKPVAVTPGTSYTLEVQWMRSGIYTTTIYNEPATYGETQHRTLSVLNY